MIQGTFRLGAEVISVIIEGNNMKFLDITTGTLTTIEGLKLSRNGIIKEFPDLKDREDWRSEAIKRLKEYIKTFKTEKEKIYYVKDELQKQGYEPMLLQRAGFRPERFK